MEAQYKIIGGDGREYGPATLEELKSWVRDGRVSAATQTCRDDLNAWSPAGEYPELADVLEGHPPAIPTRASDPAKDEVSVGFWARLAAYVVDSLTVSVMFSIVWPLVSYLTGWKLPQFPSPETIGPNVTVETLMPMITDYVKALEAAMPILVAYTITQRLVHMAYFVSLNGRYGATLGKMIIGARIVRMDGSALGYKWACLRWLAAIVSEFVCYIGYLFIAFRPDKRGLHDLLAGTKVIYKR
jgi:uncharacterized RDD family membrane protein YckC